MVDSRDLYYDAQERDNEDVSPPVPFDALRERLYARAQTAEWKEAEPWAMAVLRVVDAILADPTIRISFPAGGGATDG